MTETAIRSEEVFDMLRTLEDWYDLSLSRGEVPVKLLLRNIVDMFKQHDLFAAVPTYFPKYYTADDLVEDLLIVGYWLPSADLRSYFFSIGTESNLLQRFSDFNNRMEEESISPWDGEDDYFSNDMYAEEGYNPYSGSYEQEMYYEDDEE